MPYFKTVSKIESIISHRAPPLLALRRDAQPAQDLRQCAFQGPASAHGAWILNSLPREFHLHLFLLYAGNAC